MLSRTADSLFWTARYLERADFLARILDSALRLSSMPAAKAGPNTWESVIASAGAAAVSACFVQDAASTASARESRAHEGDRNPGNACAPHQAALMPSRKIARNNICRTIPALRLSKSDPL